VANKFESSKKVLHSDFMHLRYPPQLASNLFNFRLCKTCWISWQKLVII